jgi:hypothetical protein
MTRLILALSMAFLVGLFAIPGYNATAQGFADSSDRAQLAAPGSYRTVAWHRYYHREYWRDDDDFDRPIVRRYYYDPDPYYPYTYYYEPGFSVDVPFFSFHVR